MVYASEMFGAPPLLIASLKTSVGFASHHSPVHHHHYSYKLTSTR
ncbi:hypothetical protein LINPERPRIM_LOCUS8925 [Linum perenne]